MVASLTLLVILNFNSSFCYSTNVDPTFESREQWNAYHEQQQRKHELIHVLKTFKHSQAVEVHAAIVNHLYNPLTHFSRNAYHNEEKKITTLLADMQTFLLPDVLEDLRSPANLRYQARSLLAQNGQKRDWRPLFCPRA